MPSKPPGCGSSAWDPSDEAPQSRRRRSTSSPLDQPLELARGTEALWETWEEFRLQETEVRDLGDSVLWMGRMELKGGASHVELDQEFAIRFSVRDGEIARGKAFLSSQEALEAAGLSE
jgi:ketosteroid isomerase-like protein